MVLGVVRVHFVGTHADGLSGRPLEDVVFIDDMVVHEAARFPDGPRSATIRVELPPDEMRADFLERTLLRVRPGVYVPLADVVVLTDDNPRTEDATAIIAEIAAGMRDADAALVINDRAEAIEAALGRAEPGDLVLIAGKGHETYQVVGDRQYDFDDRLVAYGVLAGRTPSGSRDGETPAP